MTLVAIDRVTIHSNRRPLNDQKVAQLMQSIQANGLLNPITLDQNFTLLAGLHRLTACKLLGLDQIDCRIVTCEDDDHARLAEIDENLIRNELEALERSELWLERDQILERMGLRARSGDNQYTQTGGATNSPPKTTVELARETGYTERTFQLGKQIAKNIAPEVKQAIKGTPVAKSPSSLLKVARAGSKERELAEQAEQAARQQQADREQQARLAAEARAKQTELQMIALQSTTAEKAAKQSIKPQKDKPAAKSVTLPRSQSGDEWTLDRHFIFCGDTSQSDFIHLLPSNAALAIVRLEEAWNHDYLIDEANVVAVLCSEGQIHNFCSRHRMPLQFEWIFDGLYIAICSRQPILSPDKPIGLEGIESIVAYLISLYTKSDSFVIAPFIGHGEVLISCERMGRICFAGDRHLELIDRAVSRWQIWTGKIAQKEAASPADYTQLQSIDR